MENDQQHYSNINTSSFHPDFHEKSNQDKIQNNYNCEARNRFNSMNTMPHVNYNLGNYDNNRVNYQREYQYNNNINNIANYSNKQSSFTNKKRKSSFALTNTKDRSNHNSNFNDFRTIKSYNSLYSNKTTNNTKENLNKEEELGLQLCFDEHDFFNDMFNEMKLKEPDNSALCKNSNNYNIQCREYTSCKECHCCENCCKISNYCESKSQYSSQFEENMQPARKRSFSQSIFGEETCKPDVEDQDDKNYNYLNNPFQISNFDTAKIYEDSPFINQKLYWKADENDNINISYNNSTTQIIGNPETTPNNNVLESNYFNNNASSNIPYNNSSNFLNPTPILPNINNAKNSINNNKNNYNKNTSLGIDYRNNSIPKINSVNENSNSKNSNNSSMSKDKNDSINISNLKKIITNTNTNNIITTSHLFDSDLNVNYNNMSTQNLSVQELNRNITNNNKKSDNPNDFHNFCISGGNKNDTIKNYSQYQNLYPSPHHNNNINININHISKLNTLCRQELSHKNRNSSHSTDKAFSRKKLESYVNSYYNQNSANSINNNNNNIKEGSPNSMTNNDDWSQVYSSDSALKNNYINSANNANNINKKVSFKLPDKRRSGFNYFSHHFSEFQKHFENIESAYKNNYINNNRNINSSNRRNSQSYNSLNEICSNNLEKKKFNGNPINVIIEHAKQEKNNDYKNYLCNQSKDNYLIKAIKEYDETYDNGAKSNILNDDYAKILINSEINKANTSNKIINNNINNTELDNNNNPSDNTNLNSNIKNKKFFFFTSKALVNESNTEEADCLDNNSKSKLCCSCKNSHCLKLYCECFKAGGYCKRGICRCYDCFNSEQFEILRQKSIKHLKNKSRIAFKPKAVVDPLSEKKKHISGCYCKQSGCKKNYCECFQNKVKCTGNCKCIGCENHSNNINDSMNDCKNTNTTLAMITEKTNDNLGNNDDDINIKNKDAIDKENNDNYNNASKVNESISTKTKINVNFNVNSLNQVSDNTGKIGYSNSNKLQAQI